MFILFYYNPNDPPATPAVAPDSEYVSHVRDAGREHLTCPNKIVPLFIPKKRNRQTLSKNPSPAQSFI